jgi:hypothetical protein
LHGQSEDPSFLATAANEKARAWIVVVGMLVERGYFEHIWCYIGDNNDCSFRAPEIEDANERLQEEADRRHFQCDLLRAGADRDEAKVTRLLRRREETRSRHFRERLRSWIQGGLESLTSNISHSEEQGGWAPPMSVPTLPDTDSPDEAVAVG